LNNPVIWVRHLNMRLTVTYTDSTDPTLATQKEENYGKVKL